MVSVMMRLRNLGLGILMLLLVMGLRVPVLSPDSSGVSGGQRTPIAAVDATEYNAGRVRQGEIVEALFRISNLGSAALVLGPISEPCGCTASLVASPVLEPHEITTVKVSLDTLSIEGATTKTVRVTTNDPGAATLPLLVHADVTPNFILSRRTVDFGQLGAAAVHDASAIFFTATTSGEHEKIASVRSTHAVFIAGQQAIPRGIRVEVRLAGSTTVGEHRGNLVLVTTHTRQSELRVPVRAEVVP
jgi:hypothetical protein